MKIATWNVNSIRTRLGHVTDWLQKTGVDVLCLQETKVVDELFPIESFQAIGYHAAFSGQKSYNGVAILSRSPLESVLTGFAAVLESEQPAEELATIAELDAQKRVISGVSNGIRIVNLYVPNGSAIGSDKYTYKLRWLAALHDYLETLNQREPKNLLVCGDFNVALEDLDIHDPTGREKMVMATDLERQALQRAVLELGFADGFRKFTSEGGHYSWWDYRTGAFRRNRGWRIDHIYLTPQLYETSIACTIDVEPRKLEQPSDHTPVVIEFA